MRNDFDLTGARVYVAGHRGMVGSAIVRRLGQEPVTVLTATRAEVDLRRQDAVEAWFAANRPDVVVDAAATVGGIHANNSYPADFLYDNLAIQTNLLHAAHRSKARKVLFLGSSCIYPREAPQPLHEDSLLTGPLEDTNQWYAVAKIAGIKMSEAYRRQHGRDFISAMPTNLYGPFDNFDLETSHVLPALLVKAHRAKLEGAAEMIVWGSGRPMREFLYVDDLADACVFLLKHYSHAQHINVGTGTDVTIRELAATICRIVGFEGRLVFDAGKPDGTPRKLMDVSRLAALGWRAPTDLETGIRRTYDWFLAHQNALRRVQYGTATTA